MTLLPTRWCVFRLSLFHRFMFVFASGSNSPAAKHWTLKWDLEYIQYFLMDSGSQHHM